MTEYILIISVVGLGSLLALGFFSGKINKLFSSNQSGLNSAVSPGSGTSVGSGTANGPGNEAHCVYDISYQYYKKGAITGVPSRVPSGQEGVYTIGYVLNLAKTTGNPNQCDDLNGELPNNAPTNFKNDAGWDFTCSWYTANDYSGPGAEYWTPNGGTTQFEYGCMNPPVPVPGFVTIAPTGIVLLGTDLVATTSNWENNPTSYTFHWEHTRQGETVCSSVANHWTSFDDNTRNAPTDTQTLDNTQGSDDGNRCYRVHVTGTNSYGDSLTDALSNSVQVNNPPAPTLGVVDLTPHGPFTLGTSDLTATTSGWVPPGSRYVFRWYRTNQFAQGGSCPAFGNNPFDTNPGGNNNTTGNPVDQQQLDANLGSTDGNRCYKVTVTASNAGGNSAPATSNTVRVDNPPPPTCNNGGSGLTPSGTVAWATPLTYQSSCQNAVEYRYVWQQANTCGSNFSTWDTDPGGNNNTTNNTSSTENSNDFGQGDANKCYRVTVTAYNAVNQTTTSTSNSVFMNAPPNPTCAQPSITGGNASVAFRTTLTATSNCTGATTYSYTWQRGPSGTACAAVGSWSTFDNDNNTTRTTSTENGNQFDDNDGNRCYRVQVYAYNAAGLPNNGVNTTTPGVFMQASPVSGTLGINFPGNSLQVGEQMTLDTGNVNGSPTITYSNYQWQICDANGGGCVDSGTSATRTVVASEAGKRFKVKATGTNSAGGFNFPYSGLTPTVTPNNLTISITPSNNTNLPTVGTLVTANNTWSGVAPTITYRWMRCNSSGNNTSTINGAIGQTYTITLADKNANNQGYICVEVTATYGNGSTTQVSAPAIRIR